MYRKEKDKKVGDIISKLKNTSITAIKKNNYEKALAAISACANILYEYNQVYEDDELEQMLLQIGKQIIKCDSQIYNQLKNSNTVLFYDSFGMDLRGHVIVYTKAIVKNGYHLVYVTNEKARDNQPNLKRELEGYDVDWIYINMNKSYLEWITSLFYIFEKNKPQNAFFYTTPFDVAGTVVFDRLENYVYRYLIDLTDHAFWLGKYAADLFIGSRDLAASISFFHRNIEKDKLAMLDVNLYVNCNMKLGPMPFDVDKNKFIFSGGSLYKTLGDPDNKFYAIVEHVLVNNPDIFYVYAGFGDDSQLKNLQYKFKGRVYHLPERTDFYQIMERCIIYLNTYPMFGGLMMRYAANAGKIPITLRHNNDADGLLFDQNDREIQYDDFDTLVKDLDHLLNDKEYLNTREKKLNGAIMTEECFVRNIGLLIKEKRTEYCYHIQEVDTADFRDEYRRRYDCKYGFEHAIAKSINRSLIISFPKFFLKKFVSKLKIKFTERKIKDD
ncbi:hypothetical protein [Clostridium ljungdahlii]|uniref:Glycosyl transferases group 1 n=1 Tax=Clostridium ljungdahlii TaxID=1538 RepID=A0A162L0U1_9CLOT|nr:hypothetical protein [Clostridium ljungdahlii]OAA86946.1 hypothetical protein WY13_02341 [Clostridium ljungdahlii]